MAIPFQSRMRRSLTDMPHFCFCQINANLMLAKGDQPARQRRACSAYPSGAIASRAPSSRLPALGQAPARWLASISQTSAQQCRVEARAAVEKDGGNQLPQGGLLRSNRAAGSTVRALIKPPEQARKASRMLPWALAIGSPLRWSVSVIEVCPRRENAGTMSLLQSDPPVGGGHSHEFIVRAERAGRMPRPWIWAIYKSNRPEALHRSSRSYRSAEEAWTVGNKMLVLLGRHGWRKPHAPISRRMNSSENVCGEVAA